MRVEVLKITRNWANLGYESREFETKADLMTYILKALDDRDLLTLVLHIERGDGE